MKLKLKKQHIIIGGAILIFLVILLIVLLVVNGKETDAKKFKKEYEAYNGEKSSNGSKYQKLKISKKNKVKYIEMEDAVETLETGTGLIYFGFSNCPWCRGLIETLLDEVEEADLDNLLYVDVTGKRDEYVVEDEKAVVKTRAENSYYEVVDLLEDYLDDYVVKDENGMEYETGKKRLFVPLIVAVKDGLVRGVYDGVELEEDQSPYDELTSMQLDELSVAFEGLIKEVEDNVPVCGDEHC